MRFHTVTLEHLERLDPLLREAYEKNVSFVPRLRRYVTMSPTGWVFLEDGGTPVAMGGVIVHGDVAYLGLMAVAKRAQRRGLGFAVGEEVVLRAEKLGARTCLLDASAAGEALYPRLGFVEDGWTHELVREAPPTESRRSLAIPTVDVEAQDRAAFGADRRAALRILTEEFPGRLLSVPGGYVLAQTDVLGPFVATSVGVADELLSAASALVPRGRALVPDSAPAALAFFETRGFRQARALRHMRRGPVVVAERADAYWARGSFAMG